MKKFILLAACALGSYVSYAGGYRVSTQGQRALAMGHTGVAVINTAELAFFNPSGLVYLENKLNISAGVTGVISNTRYQNSSDQTSAETKNTLSTPFNLYATYKFNDWLSAGLAVYTPYGSSVEYPDQWAGADLVRSIDLKSIYFNPVFGIKLSDHFSIGGGPIYVNGSVEFNRTLSRGQNFSNNAASISIEETGISAWGWTASATIKPNDMVTVGINYRSRIDMKAEGGDVSFQNASSLSATRFDAELPLPAELTVGLSVQVTEKLLLATDFNYAFWDVYKSLNLNFNGTPGQSVNARNYKDALIFRIGGEYNLSNKLDLRAGYYFDESPVQSGFFAPETPRNDSHNFTGGFSYHINDKLSIDASFAYLYFDEIDESYDSNPNDTTAPFSGTYKSNGFLGGLGITYQL